MPTMPKPPMKRTLEGAKRYNLVISEDAMYEFTEALKANNIQLTSEDEVTITKDIAVTGPYNYRQVNLRHQILMEVAKVYEPLMSDDGDKCLTDSKHFINFLDDVYKYVLSGEKPSATVTELKTTNDNGWK